MVSLSSDSDSNEDVGRVLGSVLLSVTTWGGAKSHYFTSQTVEGRKALK